MLYLKSKRTILLQSDPISANDITNKPSFNLVDQLNGTHLQVLAVHWLAECTTGVELSTDGPGI